MSQITLMEEILLSKDDYRPPYPIPVHAIPCTNPLLEIRYTASNGRGVYATSPIPARRVIEISPILEFPEGEAEGPLGQYTYVCRREGQRRQALALGLGSLFNHSDRPNVAWYLNRQEGYLRYETTREIAGEEELCIYYGSDVGWMDGVKRVEGEVQGTQENEDGMFLGLMDYSV